MRDVDFDFYDEVGDDGPDEVLDTGPRRRVPSWVPALMIAVVVVTLFLVAVVHQGHPAPVAAPTSPLPTVLPTAPATVSGHAPLTEAQSDFAVIADNANSRIYALAGARLYALRPDTTKQAESPVVRTGGPDDINDELVLDDRHDIVWVVPQAGGPASTGRGAIEGFDGRTMHLIHRVPTVGPVLSAAVLDGKLYVLGGRRLLRVDVSDDSFRIMARTDASALGLVADPSRRRLLVSEFGPTPAVRTFVHDRLSSPITLPFNQGGVEVVGSTIWAGGATAGTPVLARLDPRTLGSGPNLARQAHLTIEVVLDSVGAHSLYALDDDGERLSCLSGTTGRLLHRFPEPTGELVTVDGNGYVDTAHGLRRVPMGRCPG